MIEINFSFFKYQNTESNPDISDIISIQISSIESNLIQQARMVWKLLHQYKFIQILCIAICKCFKMKKNLTFLKNKSNLSLNWNKQNNTKKLVALIFCMEMTSLGFSSVIALART